MFEGFEETTIELGGSAVFLRYGGDGPPILLVHGHPRTSSTWHRVAPLLVAAGHTVVCADLRGYGRSRGPAPASDHSAHSKRAAAGDLAAAMSALGYERFAVAGHDRGGPVAFRLALDAPDRVTRFAALDSIPLTEHLRRADRRFAKAWWHWFFFAQPELPERAIAADPDTWYPGDPSVMGEENHAEFVQATRDPRVQRAMLEDYRAGLTVDARDEEADRAGGRRLACPVLALWALEDDLEELHGDPRAIWWEWADDVSGAGIHSGHHMAELAPEELAGALAEFTAADR